MHDVAFDALERIPAPTADDFRRRYVRGRRPVVLTGLADEWPASRRWSLDYFATATGASSVAGAPLHDGRPRALRNTPTWEHVSLADAVDGIRSARPTHYVMASTTGVGTLRDDVAAPAYCARSTWLRSKVWVGPAGVVTPLHWDVPHNFHTAIDGRKRFILFAPRDWRALYPCSPLSPTPNFSRVDIEAPDYARFPRFAHATAVGCTLEPGETLFIPSGWWHHTRLLDAAISVNFWWGGPIISALATASLVVKRLLGLYGGEWS